jgi:acetolactate synthase small subunit
MKNLLRMQILILMLQGHIKTTTHAKEIQERIQEEFGTEHNTQDVEDTIIVLKAESETEQREEVLNYLENYGNRC